MDIENILKTAIQYIGNKRYLEATEHLQSALDGLRKKGTLNVSTEELETYYTEKEVYGMTKKEQIGIIKNFDENQKIPYFESGRVELILKLQKGLQKG